MYIYILYKRMALHFTRGKWGFENDSSFLRAGSSYLRAASFGLPTNNKKARGDNCSRQPC